MSPTSQRHLSFIRNQATHWLEKDKASTVTVTISPTPVNIYKEANLVADGIADGNDSFMRALLTAMLVANTTDLVKIRNAWSFEWERYLLIGQTLKEIEHGSS